MTAYYNEIDEYAAEWLRNLIAAGHIAPGEVDTRSIEDVHPDDLRGFTQCHFFAGIGVWSYALRRAGWADDRPVWTGSCPCQPFSAAGKRGGTADERHLWPAFFHLIEARRPALVLGEQVASKDGLAWLDTVSADLEGAGYAVGAVDLCAAGVGAPHIRQRLWFVGAAGIVGDTSGSGLSEQRRDGKIPSAALRAPQGQSAQRAGSPVGGLADDDDEQGSSGRGIQRLRQGDGEGVGAARERSEGLRADGGLAHSDGGDSCAEGLQRSGQHGQQPQDGGAVRVAVANGGQRCRIADGEGCVANGETTGRVEGDGIAQSGGELCERPGPTNGFWRDADWLLCRDERWRPVETGTFPLAHGAPARVGRLRAYGNAIVASVAQEFIEAVDWSIGGDLA